MSKWIEKRRPKNEKIIQHKSAEQAKAFAILRNQRSQVGDKTGNKTALRRQTGTETESRNVVRNQQQDIDSPSPALALSVTASSKMSL